MCFRTLVPLLTLTIMASLPGRAQRLHLENEIRKIVRLDDDIDLNQGSCTVIGIIDGDSTYTYQWGTLEHQSQSPVTDTSLFVAGGVSHAQLILLTYHMMQLGLINIDDSLGRFQFREFSGSRLNTFTIGSLLSHNTGLPAILPELTHLKADPDDDYKDYTETAIGSALVVRTKESGPEGNRPFSHYNQYLLSKVLWAVKDKRVHDNGRMIPEMSHTWFLPLDALKAGSIPAHYTAQQRMLSMPHFNALTPAMGMVTCMDDLVIMTKVLLRLSVQSDFQKTFLDARTTRTKKGIPLSKGGFRMIDGHKSGNIYFMTGLLKGESAFLCFAPKTHTAVIILHNAGVSQHILGHQIMRMINYQYTRTY